ncbi:MAG: hypothetical protein WAO91_05380 [Candidatus Nitrosotenuis sp.]
MGKMLMLLVLVALSILAIQDAHAATIKQVMEGSVDVTISYPDSVVAGRDFSVTVLVQNNGWEDKQDITISIDAQSDSILAKNQTLKVERLSKGGSFGGVLEFESSGDSKIGTHYLNAVYSQILLSNNETPTPPMQKNIAIPIEIKGVPEVQLNTITPSAIFPDAEFPFDVEIISKDIIMRDVLVRINPPSDVTIRGQTSFSYTSVEKNVPLSIRTQIVTSPEEVTLEHKLPFEVSVKYTDDSGQEQTISKTVMLLLRPRTFMEFTTDGGVWVGGVFLAPYVSIGTLVGIPAGALFSLVIRKLQKKKGTKKKKK